MEGFIAGEPVHFVPQLGEVSEYNFTGPAMLMQVARKGDQPVTMTFSPGPQVKGRQKLEFGMEILFKAEGMARRCKGIVTGSNDTGWHVTGVRRPNGLTSSFHSLHRERIWTIAEHQAEKTRPGTRESTSQGGSTISAAESRRRAAVGRQRVHLDEGAVLTHRIFVSRMKNTLSRLAKSNGYSPDYIVVGGALHSSDADANELYSVYVTAAMNSYRTETSKAPGKDLEELQKVLDGSAEECRILMSMTRAGKTAALRNITTRQRYLQEHSSYDGTQEEERDNRMMRVIVGQHHSAPVHESGAAKQAQLAYGVVTQLEALDDPVAAGIIRMKFGLDLFEHGYKERDIAAALNRAKIPAPDGERWGADHVKTKLTSALANLARARSVQDLRGLLDGH